MAVFSNLEGPILNAFILGIVILMLYTPYTLAKGVKQLQYGKNLPFKVLANCWIPFYNIYISDVGYFGKPYLATYGMLALLVIPIRVACWYFMYDNSIVTLISIILFYVGILFWYFANVATSVIIMRDSQIIPTWKCILYSIVYPFGYMYIGNMLVAAMNRKASKLSGGSRL